MSLDTSSSSSCLSSTVSRSAKRQKIQKYSKESLQEAMRVVKAGMSYSAASRQFQIPRKTLMNRVKGQHAGEIGRPTVLNKAMEFELVNWLKDCDTLGDPRTPEQFLQAVAKLAKHQKGEKETTFKRGLPDYSFVKRFKKKHEEIRFHKPQQLTRTAANVAPWNIQENISKVREYLIAQGFGHILDDPKAFGNGDETEYSLNPIPSKVLAKVRSKAYKVERSSPEDNVTVFNCILASGESLNPQIILKESSGAIDDVAQACEGENLNSCEFF